MNTSKTTHSECDDCGAWCCKHQLVTVDKDKDPVEYEHWLLRSIEHQEMSNGETAFVISQPCPLLVDDRCSVYENRGRTCEVFPNNYVQEWALYCKLMKKKFEKRPAKGFKILVNTQ